MKKIILICLITCFTFIPNIHSEPSNTVKKLMNEPISMLDWGLYRIEKDLSRVLPKILQGAAKKLKTDSVNVSTRYNWIKNNITIYCSMTNRNKSLSENEIKVICNTFINVIKKHFFITNTEEFRMKGGVGHYFTHTNYRSMDITDNFLKNLENIIELEIVITNKHIHNKIIGVEAFSKLNSKDIYYKLNKVGSEK